MICHLFDSFSSFLFWLWIFSHSLGCTICSPSTALIVQALFSLRIPMGVSGYGHCQLIAPIQNEWLSKDSIFCTTICSTRNITRQTRTIPHFKHIQTAIVRHKLLFTVSFFGLTRVNFNRLMASRWSVCPHDRCKWALNGIAAQLYISVCFWHVTFCKRFKLVDLFSLSIVCQAKAPFFLFNLFYVNRSFALEKKRFMRWIALSEANCKIYCMPTIASSNNENNDACPNECAWLRTKRAMTNAVNGKRIHSLTASWTKSRSRPEEATKIRIPPS